MNDEPLIERFKGFFVPSNFELVVKIYQNLKNLLFKLSELKVYLKVN
jgi:hypothetical protein